VVDTVGTSGVCDVFPGAINSIPSRVRLDLDVRDTDAARRDRVLVQLDEACGAIAARRGVSIRKEMINADAPTRCATEALEQACRQQGLPFDLMVSRAYHDSLFMARVAPVGMLFIPCRAGVSHRPDEYASPEAIEQGIQVLSAALGNLGMC
jgi:N-carbamoyl-L-amino-acid hydrolase